MKPTEEMLKGWAEWVAGRPEKVRVVAERFEPWNLYRMKTTDHMVRIVSFQESDPVTLTVLVAQEFNPDMLLCFDRNVFGVLPEDLERPQ